MYIHSNKQLRICNKSGTSSPRASGWRQTKHWKQSQLKVETKMLHANEAAREEGGVATVR